MYVLNQSRALGERLTIGMGVINIHACVVQGQSPSPLTISWHTVSIIINRPITVSGD